MRLYDCDTAPSPRRVRIFLAEKGIDVEKVQVDLASGEQFGPEFRRINPDCVVPVLELDDGETITEATAICHYLDSVKPEPPLCGRTPLERARVLEWNSKVEQHGLLAMAEMFRNKAKGLESHALTGPDPYQQIPALVERGRQRVLSFFARLDERLAGNAFLAGENFSLADITALVLVDFAGWMKVVIPDEAASLQRWYGAVSGRPSARA